MTERFLTYPADVWVDLDPADFRGLQSGVEMDDTTHTPVPGQPETVLIMFKDGRPPLRVVGTVREIFPRMQQAEREGRSFPSSPVSFD